MLSGLSSLDKRLRELDARLLQAGPERTQLLNAQATAVKELTAVKEPVMLLAAAGEDHPAGNRPALPHHVEPQRLVAAPGPVAALPPPAETRLARRATPSAVSMATRAPEPAPSEGLPDPFLRMAEHLTAELLALLKKTLRDHNARQAEAWAKEPEGIQAVGHLLGVLAMEEILTAASPLETQRSAAVVVGRALEIVAQRAARVPAGFLPWLQQHRTTLYTIAANHFRGLFERWLRVAPTDLVAQAPASVAAEQQANKRLDQMRQEKEAAERESQRLRELYEPDQHDDLLVKLLRDKVKLAYWITEAQKRKGKGGTAVLGSDLGPESVHEAAVEVARQARRDFYYRTANPGSTNRPGAWRNSRWMRRASEPSTRNRKKPSGGSRPSCPI